MSSPIAQADPNLWPLSGLFSGPTTQSGSSSATFGPGGSFGQLVTALEQDGANSATSASATSAATSSTQLSAAVQNFLDTLKQSIGTAQSVSTTASASSSSQQQSGTTETNSSAPTSHHHGHHHGGGGSSWLTQLIDGSSTTATPGSNASGNSNALSAATYALQRLGQPVNSTSASAAGSTLLAMG
jgi:peptidoglycan DL-endopeptidase CwlO